MDPLVSVIVPTYNTARTLGKCIESVVKQSYSNWEVIIVDSYSHDRTEEIALEWCRVLGEDKCRYYRTRRRYGAAARNVGVKNCRGDIVYTHDSDQYLSLNVLAECVRAIQSGYDCVEIPVKFMVPRGYFQRSVFYSIWPTQPDAAKYPGCFKKSDWLKLGGQDETAFHGEDLEFSLRVRRAGLKIARVEATSLHDQNWSWRQMIYKAQWLQRGKKRLRSIKSEYSVEDRRMTVFLTSMSAFAAYPRYLPGVALALLTRRIARFLVGGIGW